MIVIKMEKRLLRIELYDLPFFYENEMGVKDDLNADSVCRLPIAFYLQDMINTVGHKLIRNMTPKVYIHQTEEIQHYAIDSDTASHLLKGKMGEIKLGTKDEDENYRGSNFIIFSKSKLLEYVDILDQYKYILQCYYESLLSYFGHFNIETKSLEESFKKLQTNDFFETMENHKNLKKKVIAIIQKRENCNKTEWQFKILNFEYEVLFSQKLKEFDFYSKRIKDGKWIDYQRDELTIPHSYISDEGWGKDVFKFTWGMPDRNKDVEHYEFSLKTMQLTKID